MDNPRFVDEKDIPLIDEDDYNDEQSRYDTLDTSRVEETLFTTQDTTKHRDDNLKQMNRELVRERVIDLYKYLGINNGNVDLVDIKKFRYEKSRSGPEKFYFFNDNTWIRLTNKQNGNFLAKSTILKAFGGLNQMKNILITNEIPQLDQLFTAAKKLQDQLPTDLEMEDISTARSLNSCRAGACCYERSSNKH